MEKPAQVVSVVSGLGRRPMRAPPAPPRQAPLRSVKIDGAIKKYSLAGDSFPLGFPLSYVGLWPKLHCLPSTTQ